MACLKVIRGVNTGQIWEIKSTKAVLGRHPECDVPIDVPDASRYHAQLTMEAGEYYLEDLRSRNGTSINDELIDGRQKLHDGDRIRITTVVLKFFAGSFAEKHVDEPFLADLPPVLECFPPSLAPMEAAPEIAAEPRPEPSSAEFGLRAKVRVLLEISQSLRQALALDKVLPQILESLLVIFPSADRGLIALSDEQGEVIPRWVRFRRGDADENEDAGYGGIRISRTIVQEVMQSQKPVLSADASDDARFVTSSSLHSVPIRSMMCAPLVDGMGNSFGVLQIDSTHPTARFSEDDLDLFLSAAAQASIGIENARLHESILRQRTAEHDLEVADQIQRSLLPRNPPDLPGYEFYSYYQPAHRVGGDFFDYLPLPDGRLATLVADVVGHGLEASLWTAKLAAEMRFRLFSVPRPADAVTQLGAALNRDIPMDRFVTMLLAIIDPRTHEITFVNAGHLPAVHRQVGGRVESVIGDQQLPLGVSDSTVYEAWTIRLEPGEILIMHTDGLNEAMDAEGKRYGIERVHSVIRDANTVEEIGQRLAEDVRQFLGDTPQPDDMCWVCFGREERTRATIALPPGE